MSCAATQSEAFSDAMGAPIDKFIGVKEDLRFRTPPLALRISAESSRSHTLISMSGGRS
jgi:hypothetical protein